MAAIFTAFVQLLGETALPFVVGLLIGAALEVFLPKRWADRWLVTGPRSLVLATLGGALLPGCAMSAIPIARSLRNRGAPRGTVAAFLLIAPLISPHTIVFTGALIGVGFAVARVALPVAFTLLFGAVTNALAQNPSGRAADRLVTSEAHDGNNSGGCNAGCGCGQGAAPGSPLGHFGRQVWTNLRALAPLFIGSLALVAVLEAFIQPAQIARYSDGPLAYAAALVAGIPLYVCDGGEVPLTLSLLKLGVGPGPAFTFMIGSVGTCLTTIAMAFGIIGRRLTFAYVAGTLLLALLGGLIVSAWPVLHPALR